jgi:hypothetical protein
MSDEAKSAGQGQGRRAVMLGAAAVGAGVVAGVASSAGTALASSDTTTQTGFVALSRPITVRLPAAPLNIDQSIKILQEILAAAGHAGCFSGLDLQFTYESEYIVSAKGVVQAEI